MRGSAFIRVRGRTAGLTIIELLVSMALLGVVSAAIVGSFALLSTVNREASIDVDYSRFVRSVGDGILDDWRVPAEWNAGTVGGFSLSVYVAEETEGRCSGTWTAPEIPEVRVVVIECGEAGHPAFQRYVFEVGSPSL